MSEEIPEVGDIIRIVYCKSPHVGEVGVITEIDPTGEQITVVLDGGVPTVVGCEDYEFLSHSDADTLYFSV